MTNVYQAPEKISMKTRLFRIGEEVLRHEGWEVTPEPGSGKGSVRRITRGKESKLVSIRTTQDTWIAFPRDPADERWGTLSDVDAVVAVSVDDPSKPLNANVHFLDGDEVRARFDRAYAARLKAGHSIPAGRGVWVGLYQAEAAEPPSHVGCGIGLVHPPIAQVPLTNMQTPEAAGSEAKAVMQVAANMPAEQEEAPLTIAEAKRRLAATFGVAPDNIKITIEA